MPGVIAHNLFHRVGDLRTRVDVLSDVSLEAPAGEVTAVVGPAGPGQNSPPLLLPGASVLPTITVRENVALPLLIARRPHEPEAVDALLDRVGLGERRDEM